MIVRRAMKANTIIGGAGSIEMELSKILKEISMNTKGSMQIVIRSFAKALEVIPRTLANNAGLDSVSVMILLRTRHSKSGGKWFGVDINK
jgi:T-complex protein 1 subunit eta